MITAMMLRNEINVVLALALVALSVADPMILLNNAQAKCMSVDAPADSLLTIEYEAPDLVMAADLEYADGKGQPVDPPLLRRFRTTITVNQSGGRENHHGRHHGGAAPPRDRGQRVVKDLEEKRGSIEYITGQDGTVSICVQSMTASAVSPTPIALRVSEMPAEEASTKPPKQAGETLNSESQQNAKMHFSQMEKTLSGLISKTNMILRQADYAKELEVEFHEQSIAMNRASQWWPIVQLCVLLVTGFTQANHMVQFFRKHHIS